MYQHSRPTSPNRGPSSTVGSSYAESDYDGFVTAAVQHVTQNRASQQQQTADSSFASHMDYMSGRYKQGFSGRDQGGASYSGDHFVSSFDNNNNEKGSTAAAAAAAAAVSSDFDHDKSIEKTGGASTVQTGSNSSGMSRSERMKKYNAWKEKQQASPQIPSSSSSPKMNQDSKSPTPTMKQYSKNTTTVSTSQSPVLSPSPQQSPRGLGSRRMRMEKLRASPSPSMRGRVSTPPARNGSASPSMTSYSGVDINNSYANAASSPSSYPSKSTVVTDNVVRSTTEKKGYSAFRTPDRHHASPNHHPQTTFGATPSSPVVSTTTHDHPTNARDGNNRNRSRSRSSSKSSSTSSHNNGQMKVNKSTRAVGAAYVNIGTPPQPPRHVSPPPPPPQYVPSSRYSSARDQSGPSTGAPASLGGQHPGTTSYSQLGQSGVDGEKDRSNKRYSPAKYGINENVAVPMIETSPFNEKDWNEGSGHVSQMHPRSMNINNPTKKNLVDSSLRTLQQSTVENPHMMKVSSSIENKGISPVDITLRAIRSSKFSNNGGGTYSHNAVSSDNYARHETSASAFPTRPISSGANVQSEQSVQYEYSNEYVSRQDDRTVESSLASGNDTLSSWWQSTYGTSQASEVNIAISKVLSPHNQSDEDDDEDIFSGIDAPDDESLGAVEVDSNNESSIRAREAKSSKMNDRRRVSPLPLVQEVSNEYDESPDNRSSRGNVKMQEESNAYDESTGYPSPQGKVKVQVLDSTPTNSHSADITRDEEDRAYAQRRPRGRSTRKYRSEAVDTSHLEEAMMVPSEATDLSQDDDDEEEETLDATTYDLDNPTIPVEWEGSDVREQKSKIFSFKDLGCSVLDTVTLNACQVPVDAEDREKLCKLTTRIINRKAHLHLISLFIFTF